MAVPARVSDRLAAGLKHFQPILASAKSRDVNEFDTSMIVSDLLADTADSTASISRSDGTR